MSNRAGSQVEPPLVNLAGKPGGDIRFIPDWIQAMPLKKRFEFLSNYDSQFIIAPEVLRHELAVLNRKLNHAAGKKAARVSKPGAGGEEAPKKTPEEVLAELEEARNQNDYIRIMCEAVFNCAVADAPHPAETFEYWQARYCGWDVLAARPLLQRRPPIAPQYPSAADVAEAILTRTSVVEVKRVEGGEEWVKRITVRHSREWVDVDACDFWRWWSRDEDLRKNFVRETRRAHEALEPHPEPRESVYFAMGSAILTNSAFKYQGSQRVSVRAIDNLDIIDGSRGRQHRKPAQKRGIH